MICTEHVFLPEISQCSKGTIKLEKIAEKYKAGTAVRIIMYMVHSVYVTAGSRPNGSFFTQVDHLFLLTD